MKILFLAEESPKRSDQGDRVRFSNFVRELSLNHDITLIHFGNSPSENEKYIAVQRPSLLGKYLRALFHIHLPFSVTARNTGRMRKILNCIVKEAEYDLFFIYQTKMGSYSSVFSGPTVVDLTDAISLYYSRMVKFCRWPLRLLYRFEQFKMLRFERKLLKSSATCLVASEADARYLRAIAPGCKLIVIPNGVDLFYHTPSEVNDGSFDLVFVGNMAYPPNRDAVHYFYRQVFPAVLNDCPASRLVVVGKNPSPDILALQKDKAVVVTGYVTDVRPYLSKAAVVICPVRFGTGTRIKILEAMAAGRAVVSTSIGCEGLDVVSGKDILITDDTYEMAAVILNLLKDREKAHRIGLNAAETVKRIYGYEVIGHQLENVLIQSCLEKRSN